MTNTRGKIDRPPHLQYERGRRRGNCGPKVSYLVTSPVWCRLPISTCACTSPCAAARDVSRNASRSSRALRLETCDIRKRGEAFNYIIKIRFWLGGTAPRVLAPSNLERLWCWGLMQNTSQIQIAWRHFEKVYRRSNN